MPQDLHFKMEVPMDFERLSNWAAGVIKDLYFGLRHADLSYNQATISFHS